MDAAPAKFERTYDLHLCAGRRTRMRCDDRGITLTDWQLSWTADGKDDHAPLENIRQVRLMAGGDWKNPLNRCQITFADKHLLTLHDGTAWGVVDEAQTPVYADFVRALHARLAQAPPGHIEFTRGYPETNFWIVAVAAFVLGLMAVATPLVLLFIVQKWEIFFLLLGGIGFCWPLYKMVQNNAPRPYDPNNLPEELME